MAEGSVSCQELIVPGPAAALAGLVGQPDDDVDDGWGLPPLWHWVYHLDRVAQAELGPDGHSVSGVPHPSRPGLRRMFAGGRISFHNPLQIGEVATKTLEIADRRARTGRSGWMEIVTTRATITQSGRIAVVDEQDIIYREPTPLPTQPTGIASSADPIHWDGERRVPVDEVLLFRFSALTYNAHRIHYDQAYCRAEDYQSLVVHGPLQALLMCEVMRRQGPGGPGVLKFSFRLVAPLVLGQGMTVCHRREGAGLTAAVRDDAGRLTATSALIRA